MTDVLVVIGAGSIGQAVARRVGAGKHILFADLRPENAQASAQTLGSDGTGNRQESRRRFHAWNYVYSARHIARQAVEKRCGDRHSALACLRISPRKVEPAP